MHAAGLVSITEASKDKLEAVNVEGTKNVIEACKANGVEADSHKFYTRFAC
ncbi:MAG: hypothetical protein IPG26_03550 [Coprothermobacter sp.]|nr:hypothetical protein [Coprothermobacter sp.]